MPEPSGNWVDTHVHLDDERYVPDLQEVLGRSFEAGVKTLVTIGTRMEDSAWAVDYAGRQDGVFATVGIHPQFAAEWKDGDYEKLKALATRPKVVAIGESGLDYHPVRLASLAQGSNVEPSPALQAVVFRQMCRLAGELKLPLVIHQREAAEDTLRILREESGGKHGGVFHCYAGDWPTAQAAMELGFYLAVGGILTFPSAGALREVIRQVPLDRLVLETDGPWLAPQAKRGQRNEPAFLFEAAKQLAELKKVDLSEIQKATTANAMELFKPGTR